MAACSAKLKRTNEMFADLLRSLLQYKSNMEYCNLEIGNNLLSWIRNNESLGGCRERRRTDAKGKHRKALIKKGFEDCGKDKEMRQLRNYSTKS